jgi:putative aminopeptidase FrvX
MISSQFVAIVERLMRAPAAPFYETYVQREVENICEESGLPMERDAFGNIFVSWKSDSAQRPLVLAAHLDHPGFEIKRVLTPKKLLAQFQGGVPIQCFRKGTPIRVFPGSIAGKLGAKRQKQFELELQSPIVEKPQFAVWDLVDFKRNKGRIICRACDDLIGVAAILCTLQELKRTRSRVHVIGLLSRAEEVGFLGALAAMRGASIPKNALVISLEASQERPPVRMGEGVILRVGDRTSIFDSAACRFLWEVAKELEKKNRAFRFQRALMPGGTCEGTAFQEFGFQTAAVCVALGNYHNRTADNRIGEEYVEVKDGVNMVELLVSAARQLRDFTTLVHRLPRDLNRPAQKAVKRLKL